MGTPVALDTIIDGLEVQSDEAIVSLNRRTGKVVRVTEDALISVENGELRGLANEAELPDARDMIENGSDYVALPDRYEIDEYGMMVRFVESLDDENDANLLAVALDGRGAFRRFKDTVHIVGRADEWYRFRDKAYEEVAVEWCRDHDIEFYRMDDKQ